MLKSRVKIAVFAGLAFAVLAGIAVGLRHSSDEASPSSRYRLAPDFELSDVSGNRHHLSEWRGSTVLLHFWASWCPPCLGEIGAWSSLAAEFRGAPMKLVAVSLDDSWEAEKKVFGSPPAGPAGVVALLDAKTEVSDRYGSYAFPETYLISAKGEIITKWVGPQDWKSPELMKLLHSVVEKAN